MHIYHPQITRARAYAMFFFLHRLFFSNKWLILFGETGGLGRPQKNGSRGMKRYSFAKTLLSLGYNGIAKWTLWTLQNNNSNGKGLARIIVHLDLESEPRNRRTSSTWTRPSVCPHSRVHPSLSLDIYDILSRVYTPVDLSRSPWIHGCIARWSVSTCTPAYTTIKPTCVRERIILITLTVLHREEYHRLVVGKLYGY